jgi:hypothetical protein
MRGSALGTLYDAHPGKSLAARGGAMRTFSSMAIFLTLTLLGLGVYIIRAEFANPLAAQSWGLFTAAFILATGVTLLYYLVEPRKGRWRNRARRTTSISLDWVVWAARNAAAHSYQSRSDLPFQRWYVDPARIRPRR